MTSTGPEGAPAGTRRRIFTDWNRNGLDRIGRIRGMMRKQPEAERSYPVDPVDPDTRPGRGARQTAPDSSGRPGRPRDGRAWSGEPLGAARVLFMRARSPRGLDSTPGGYT